MNRLANPPVSEFGGFEGGEKVNRYGSGHLGRRIRTHYQLYLLLLLPLVYLIVFSYIPMFGVLLAFQKFNLRDGIWGSPWIGFNNFTRFFNSYMFERVMRNTLRLSIYGLFAGFPLPILFALFLNTIQNLKYKKVVQVVTYAPHFISTTVMVGMMMSILNCRNGLYGTVYYALIGAYPSNLFGSAEVFPHLYVWSGIWQHLGWDAIIYVAALSGVSPELHEAAEIDGATRFQRMIHVELAALMPTMSILLILNAGNILSVGFDKVYLMQNNTNLRTSEIISTYVYKTGLTGTTDYSYSTAIGLFNSVINIVMLLIVNFSIRRISSNSLF